MRALEDAEMTWADIDAVVIGKAPDAFEGIVQPELFLADALGRRGQADAARAHRGQRRRLDRSSSAAHLIESRIHERVLAVAWEKQTEGNAQWGLAGGRSARHRRRRRVRAVDPRVHRADRARPSTSAGRSR